MGDARQNVIAVRIEVVFEREFVPGRHLAACSRPADRDRSGRLFLHSEPRGPPIVVEDLLQLRGLLRAAAVDAVEPPRVPAGEVVPFQLVGSVQT